MERYHTLQLQMVIVINASHSSTRARADIR